YGPILTYSLVVGGLVGARLVEVPGAETLSPARSPLLLWRIYGRPSPRSPRCGDPRRVELQSSSPARSSTHVERRPPGAHRDRFTRWQAFLGPCHPVVRRRRRHCAQHV